MSYYCGIDVVPRYGGVIQTDGYTIPEKAEDDYDFIVSCNDTLTIKKFTVVLKLKEMFPLILNRKGGTDGH